MKAKNAVLWKAFILMVIMTVVCGILYPLLITGIAQVFFKDKANGSIVKVNGVSYGSELLGQQFTGNEYLWGRIMNVDTETFTDRDGNPVMFAYPSNLTPADDKYAAIIEERVAKIKQANPDADTDKIPVDLVTCSGSGMDPDISVAAANYQVERIAKNRNMTIEEVQAVIDQYTTGRFLGIFGEKTVNVLKVNLALDEIL